MRIEQEKEQVSKLVNKKAISRAQSLRSRIVGAASSACSKG